MPFFRQDALSCAFIDVPAGLSIAYIRRSFRALDRLRTDWHGGSGEVSVTIEALSTDSGLGITAGHFLDLKGLELVNDLSTYWLLSNIIGSH